VESAPTKNGAERADTRPTPRGVAKPNDMTTNDPSGQESVGAQHSVHLVCHDCPDCEDLVETKEQAFDRAREHTDESGHKLTFKKVAP